jgi:DNA-binding MarR family transcriptional regulator
MNATCARRPHLRPGAWLDALRRLKAEGLSDRAAAAALSAQLGRPVGHGSVWYWRQGDEPLSRRERARAFQLTEGWGFLLPRHELAPLEARILSCLNDWGPLTARKVCDRLGRRDDLVRQDGRRFRALARLARRGLVRARRGRAGNRLVVYEVGPAASPLPLVYDAEKFSGRVRPLHG